MRYVLIETLWLLSNLFTVQHEHVIQLLLEGDAPMIQSDLVQQSLTSIFNLLKMAILRVSDLTVFDMALSAITNASIDSEFVAGLFLHQTPITSNCF